MLTALALVGMFACGVVVGYLWRRAKPAIRVSYAGGVPFRSVSFVSANGDGSDFAKAMARVLVTGDMMVVKMPSEERT